MIVLLDQDMNATVMLSHNILLAEMDYAEGEVNMDDGSGMGLDAGMSEGSIKDPLLSSWPAIIGISSVTIVIGLLVGFLLAKKKIKKGIELDED